MINIFLLTFPSTFHVQNRMYYNCVNLFKASPLYISKLTSNYPILNKLSGRSLFTILLKMLFGTISCCFEDLS